MTNSDPWVWLARIRRPQGRKGEVFAEILTDFPERFRERQRLWLLSDPSGAVANASRSVVTGRPRSGPLPSPREFQLKHHWLHKGGVVLHFAGVDSISDAEELAGQVVAIPREERAPLAEDEIYIGDLIGCVLVDVARAERVVEVGAIEDVARDQGPVPLLVVRGPAGEVLVPFAKSYLRGVDLAARRVEMALPEGLVDLNA
ncbi:MAG TPA: ribosome maturation factor RimM [Terracidiphilus sp.]|nr:ribosome maturation factor RimM [Terracidiphilus sp.]